MRLRVPVLLNVGLLVVATTAFYTYIGQLVPQKELLPPAVIEISKDITTDEMVPIGEEIANGKGLCLTCHTIGQSGVLRFPDLAGIGSLADDRVPELSAVEYMAQSLYEPEAYIVEGFAGGMPPMDKPPISLTQDEILCVMAWLQSMGGTPTVTLQTNHAYRQDEGSSGG